jgi:hypothetical protein
MRPARTATVLTAAMISFGTTQAAAAPAGQPGEEILSFLDISRQVAVHDVGEGSSQPQPGDVLVFNNLLRHPDRSDAVTRQVLGRFPSTCTLEEGTRARCEGQLRLRDGTIDLTATPDLAVSPIDIVVTGGTGRYAGVSGSAQLTPTDVPGTSRLVVRLSRPAS